MSKLHFTYKMAAPPHKASLWSHRNLHRTSSYMQWCSPTPVNTLMWRKDYQKKNVFDAKSAMKSSICRCSNLWIPGYALVNISAVTVQQWIQWKYITGDACLRTEETAEEQECGSEATWLPVRMVGAKLSCIQNTVFTWLLLSVLFTCCSSSHKAAAVVVCAYCVTHKE